VGCQEEEATAITFPGNTLGARMTTSAISEGFSFPIRWLGIRPTYKPI